MGEIAIAKRGLDRMQLVGCTSIPLSLPESLTMDSRIMIEISGRAFDSEDLRAAFVAASAPSLPLIPIWLGIQHKVIVFPELTRWLYSFTNLSTCPVSRWML